MDLILYYLYKKNNGNWLKVYDDLKNKVKVPNDLKLKMPKNWISLLDDKYPDFLKEYYKPPFIVILENGKVYVPYGKNLKERFEVQPPIDKNPRLYGAYESKQEKEYIENLTKYQQD